MFLLNLINDKLNCGHILFLMHKQQFQSIEGKKVLKQREGTPRSVWCSDILVTIHTIVLMLF